MLQPLFFENILLVDKHLLEIDLMNPLVRIVYAQLLKTIVLEYLETVDIQKLNCSCLLLNLVA